jgi:hypothetical protein
MLVNRPCRSMKYSSIQARRAAFLCTLVIVSVCLAACARAHIKNTKSSNARHFVGEIELVSPGADFVLIDTGSSGWSVDAGTALSARDASGNETARLKIAPERKSSFVAADIVSGKPNRGDRVYQ